MVVIRLARHGAHKAPFYRIVVADQRKKRDGRIIEQVGTYDPLHDPSVIDIDMDKVNEWIAKGAQPSDRVAKIIASVTGQPLPEKLQERIDNKTEMLKKKAEEEAAKKAAEEAARKAEEEAARKAEEEAAAAEAAEAAEGDDAASEDEAVAEEVPEVAEKEDAEAAGEQEAAVEEEAADVDAAAEEAEE